MKLMNSLFTKFAVPYIVKKRKKEIFYVDGKLYYMFAHKYNTAWANERGVEVSYIRDLLKNYDSDSILEIGNVISHYFPVDWDVVDKYEKGLNVINEDIIDFHPSKRYDLIFSISTFEHIGYDEEKIDSEKILKVLNHLRNLLKPNGRIVFTGITEYNRYFKSHISHGNFGCDKEFYMLCVVNTKLNQKWVQTVKDSIYNYNCLYIGIIKTQREKD